MLANFFAVYISYTLKVLEDKIRTVKTTFIIKTIFHEFKVYFPT